MITFSRTDDSLVGRWLWAVSRPLLISFLLLIAIGILLAMSATPMVAYKIGFEKFYFLKRHILFVIPSLITIFLISSLDLSGVKKFSILMFLIFAFLMLMVFFCGHEIKGARRWVSIFGFSLQPSEFVKPAFCVITAWLLTEEKKIKEFPGRMISVVLLLFIDIILVLQPDVGMLVVINCVWFGQLFLNGLPIIFLFLALIVGVVSLGFAYLFLPHVTARIDKFLDPNIGDHYQINRSLEAFAKGGLFGVGPGEGIVKKYIPDAHADFIFSVLGEEFGVFVCILVVCLIMFIVVYGMFKAMNNNNLFSMIASFGLLAQFGLQSFINIASSLHLIPTKGMTLPFISYGGSSMFAVSVATGLLLSILKKQGGARATPRAIRQG